MTPILIFFRYSIVKNCDLSHLESIKVKCKFSNRMLLADFLFDGNCNVSHTVTVNDTFAIEIFMTLILTFRLGQGQMQISESKKPTWDFVLDGNSNVCPSCYRLLYIRSRNMHDLYLDL